ncbi:MAG: amidohydrolase [Alphaproteobacteria bacterium]|nr:amidohydrolase [Alphaproteobacteria bacterium]
MSTLIRHVLLDNKPVDILINHNKIEKIADHIPTALSDEIIMGEGKAITPAFYNMHTHSAMTLFRGIGEDKNLFDWLQTDIWPREEKLTNEQVYHASKLSILEMIKSGTVLFNDMYPFAAQTEKAADEMGVKMLSSCVAFDLFNPKMTEEKKKSMTEFMERKISSSFIKKTVSCHAVYTVSEELLCFARDLALKHHSFLHIHLAETQKEVSDSIEKTGLTPTAYLDKLGLLTNKTILAHCVWLNEEDRKIIKERGCLIAHCPTSNLKLNSGQMPFNLYKEEGLKISLGTDGASSNNSLSMFSEMKIAALSAKGQSQNITAGKVDQILHMSQKEAPQFLGINAGEIAEGTIADFILLDLNNTQLQPQSYLKSHLVYSAESNCVTDVCSNGRFILKDKYHPFENEIIDSFLKASKSIL